MSRSAEKNERVFGLARYGMLRGKTGKTFWFSSLDQIVHFDAILFCRTFVELFWSVRVDRKKKSHYNSRVSLHEAPTKNNNNLLTSIHFLKQIIDKTNGAKL